MTAVGLPSTFFTDAPGWRWLIILYFFVGGLAGGSYCLAVLIDVFGDVRDRRLARLGYYVAFPAVVLSGLILTVDLYRPDRFWHMLIESNTGRLMFKPYSPMSVGSWALLAFGAFSFVSFLAALQEENRLRWPWLAALRPPRVLGGLVALVGGLLGFFVAGYTGVLLAVTNRPIWADTTLLGLNFVISAASTSAALLILLAARRRWTAGPGIQALERFDSMLLILEALALIALIGSLGSVARVWLSAWGVVLLIGVVILGIVIPVSLQWRPRPANAPRRMTLAAVLVLVGGLVFRAVIVLSSEGLGV
jgi:formate-dependent nitrite reductase membrane component NrfD